MKYKIISVVGARPQFIKCAPVSKQLRKVFKEVIVHTGQHYDYKLSESFFKELEIPVPDYNLEVGSGRHVFQMANIMLKFDQIVEKENPDAIIVFGDTNSTAATAIVAAKNNIPLIHIEAGLREFTKFVPEEVNKLLTDAVADIYFSPTDTGVKNLSAEGKIKNVYNVGDVGIDLINNNLDKINSNSSILQKFNLEKGNYFFVTCHRAANTDDKEKLEKILSVFGELNVPVVFPMHPRTTSAVEKHNLGHLLQPEHIITMDPIGFWDTQTLLRNAKMAITDSGGIIKEAYFHKVPAVIIDTQSEWVETIEEGWNYLAGPDNEKILNRIRTYTTPNVHSNCLGDGTASKKIVEIIEKYLNDV